VLLWRSGELMPLDRIVEEQQARGALYGTAIHDNRRELRLEIIRRRQPELVALGSSVALDMRQEYFNAGFACACQATDSIDDAETFVDAMLAVVRPKLVLFFVDYWWFASKRPQIREPLKLDPEAEITRRKLFAPTNWLREKRLSPAEYFALLGGERDLHRATLHPKIGMMAIKRGLGIRADGSELSGLRLDSGAPAYYAEARELIRAADRFARNGGEWDGAGTRIAADSRVQPERLQALDRVLGKLRGAGVQVTLFLAPVAPPLAAAMNRDRRHRYLDELDHALAMRGDAYYNFHDSRRAGSTDLCEFSDTVHSGNVMFMRMLRAILVREPRSPLARYVNRARIEDAIARFAGRTIAPLETGLYVAPEVDFLEAGCRRKPADSVGQ